MTEMKTMREKYDAPFKTILRLSNILNTKPVRRKCKMVAVVGVKAMLAEAGKVTNPAYFKLKRQTVMVCLFSLKSKNP